MAYNRTFNPDALPTFAEPERKQPTYKQQAIYPPRHSSQTHSAPPDQKYAAKPPPPLPQNDLRSNSYGGAGQGRYHPQGQNDQRSSSYAGAGPARQPSPNMPVLGGYGQYSTSPPSTVGRFPPQPQYQQQSRPPPQPSRGPRSPAPGGGAADPTLLPLFRAVDKTGTGQLSEKQLGAALVNGDWSSFDIQTIRLMIRMFDTDGSGTIGFEEFCGLWSFLASWRELFDRFDADKSGNISLDEFTNALTAFGYRLSPDFIVFLFSQFDKTRTNQLSFDLFVQSCISLKRMTDVFKRYDDDRDGFIQLSFEEFLTEILRQI